MLYDGEIYRIELLDIIGIPWPENQSCYDHGCSSGFSEIFKDITVEDLVHAQEMVDGVRPLGEISVENFWIDRIDPYRKFWPKRDLRAAHLPDAKRMKVVCVDEETETETETETE